MLIPTVIYLCFPNKSLLDFTRAWNMHPLRTEGNWSPNKICTLRGTEDSDTIPPDFGIDFGGPLPDDEYC